jgi:hypothetical protein
VVKAGGSRSKGCGFETRHHAPYTGWMLAMPSYYMKIKVAKYGTPSKIIKNNPYIS